MSRRRSLGNMEIGPGVIRKCMPCLVFEDLEPVAQITAGLGQHLRRNVTVPGSEVTLNWRN